eukprot:scaffold212866_cov33-Tisochrysis_lutea.AAC.2
MGQPNSSEGARESEAHGRSGRRFLPAQNTTCPQQSVPMCMQCRRNIDASVARTAFRANIPTNRPTPMWPNAKRVGSSCAEPMLVQQSVLQPPSWPPHIPTRN